MTDFGAAWASSSAIRMVWKPKSCGTKPRRRGLQEVAPPTSACRTWGRGGLPAVAARMSRWKIMYYPQSGSLMQAPRGSHWRGESAWRPC